MDDLISRQAAIDAMTEYYWSIMGDEPPTLDEKTALYVDLKQVVKRLPTAEPREGEWIGIDDEPCEVWECDKCGHIVECDGTLALPNYCENCGARMEN